MSVRAGISSDSRVTTAVGLKTLRDFLPIRDSLSENSQHEKVLGHQTDLSLDTGFLHLSGCFWWKGNGIWFILGKTFRNFIISLTWSPEVGLAMGLVGLAAQWCYPGSLLSFPLPLCRPLSDPCWGKDTSLPPDDKRVPLPGMVSHEREDFPRRLPAEICSRNIPEAAPGWRP